MENNKFNEIFIKNYTFFYKFYTDFLATEFY